jgi:hypothetical protein
VKTVQGETFINQVVHLGSTRFENCKFIRCKLVFNGEGTSLAHSEFDDCELELEGAAANTIQFLTSLYPIEFGMYVEEIRESIRQGAMLGRLRAN